ncbi:MAG: hypothetical protein WBP45_04300, partial [Daejeonella sp.]
IILGAVFIVVLAVSLGIVSGGKKLFEILFFVFTYANVNKVPFMDYFGGMNNTGLYIYMLIAIISCLLILSFVRRKYEIRNL